MKLITQYLFIPAILIIIIGLVAGIVGQTWLPIPAFLLCLGVILFFVWLGLNKSLWSKRSSRVWTNYTITTLAVLLIFILLNFLANRYSIRLDLTENQQLSLSPQSQEIIKNLSNPLKVWVFEYPPDSRDEDLLENYQQYNSNFQFQFVDPQINIPLAQKFNVQYPGAVYLEYNNKQYLVQQLNEVERISEINLTNGIAKIQRDRLFNIYFLQGHGEYPLEGAEGSLSVAISNLANQGYQVQPLNLAQSLIIPGNTNLIIIAGSQRELLAEEAAVLTNYLNNQGGRLLIMVNPNSNLGLDDLLKDWGVELDERLVIDLSTTSSMLNLGPGIPIVTNYGNHPISKDFQEGISLYPLARAVITNTIEGIETVPLLITNEQTWAESDLESEQITFDQETDLKGPLNLGVALKNTESDSRLVVFGNGTFATNGWFEQQLNGDIFLNTIEWLVDDPQSVLSIRPKDPQNRRLNLTVLQAGILVSLALLIIPLSSFITAIIIWWRRRL